MAGIKKNRCTFKECQLTAQRIVGDCGFCQGHFCSKHRLLEDHKCEGLEDVGIPDALACLSTSASSTSSTQSTPTTSRNLQWWLVGLSDLLASDDMDMADVAGLSAKSSRTSGTPPSSRTSGPRSSRVFNENYDDDDDEEAPGGDVRMRGA